jgi:hypothetical protein
MEIVTQGTAAAGAGPVTAPPLLRYGVTVTLPVMNGWIRQMKL